MSRRMTFAAITVVLVGSIGCQTTRLITTHGELADVRADQAITVHLHGSRFYRLDQHVFADSVIRGSGTFSERGATTSFAGAIPIDSIVAIETSSTSVMKTLLLAGLTAVIVTGIVEGSKSGGGLTATEGVDYRSPVTGGGGGTSCPYVYAWNGARYELQAEPFGTAWGRALEVTTWHLLPCARVQDGMVRLQLANERRETHYVNSLRLYAVDLGRAPAAVVDVGGTVWPLCRPAAPTAARERSGRDILADIAAADGRRWECAASSLTAGSGYEDVLEVSFARPPGTSVASLVVTGINTTLSAEILGHVCRAVGSQTAALAHAVETDPVLVAELRTYLEDASLAVSVWNGRRWEPAGAFRPEASAVDFTRALRIHVPPGAGDTVRVRLRGMADVWTIDRLAADWTVAHALRSSPVPLVSATGPSGEDVREELGSDDAHYEILLPPDRVNLAFAATRSPGGEKWAYVVAGRGYLHEWDPETASTAPAAFPASADADASIEFLKELLKHRELALQPVYDAWRAARLR